MTIASTLGAVARHLGRTPYGRRAGTSAYRAVARAAAFRLSRIPGVSSAYLMGSLARGEAVDPGYSDIDLVVACDFPSVRAEIETMARLGHWQTQASVLGGLLYNLDCYDVREVPFARAFGGAWEMRFDEEGLCLAGEPLWSTRVRRSRVSLRREQLSYALRRWVNTGARLLDPRVPENADAVWDAQRLVVDVAALFAGKLTAPNAEGLLDAFAESPSSSATAELRARGVEACGPREIRSVLVPAALEILEAFADEVTSEYRSPLSVVSSVRPFTPHPELPLLGRALLAAPFESIVLLQRGPAPGGHIPIAVAAAGATPRNVARVFAERLAAARSSLPVLGGWCRRPVPLSSKLWSALAVVEPAPFLAAAAARPLWSAGRPLGPPRGPGPDGLEDALTSSAVQSFSLCRGMDLRPGKPARQRHQITWDKFALLPALDRALETQTFDVSFTQVDETRARDAGARVRMLRDFSERHRTRLAPLLAARLAE